MAWCDVGKERAFQGQIESEVGSLIWEGNLPDWPIDYQTIDSTLAAMTAKFWIVFFMALAVISLVGVILGLPELIDKLRRKKR